MIELHHYPSTAAMAPHILLEEIGVPFELVPVDRARDEHKSPGYLALNPNGLIPVLVDGDLVLFESAAICLHLADTHPAAALAPAPGTPERAHLYKWLAWLTNTLQSRLLIYFYPERWADDAAAIAQVRGRARANVGAMLTVLDAELARHGGPWAARRRFQPARSLCTDAVPLDPRLRSPGPRPCPARPLPRTRAGPARDPAGVRARRDCAALGLRKPDGLARRR